MPELSKQDIKEVFTETLEPFAKAVQEDFQGLKADIQEVKQGLKADIQEVKQGLKADIQEVRIELQAVKTDVQEIKRNSSELFTKLDKFISLYEKQEQELLILGAQMRRLEERVAKLETNQ